MSLASYYCSTPLLPVAYHDGAILQGMTHSFSIQEAIRFGWRTVKNHSATVFQVVLTLLALQVVGAIVEKVLRDTMLGDLAGLVLTIVSIFIGTGAMYIVLKLARGEHAAYNQIWPDWRLVWRYFCAGFLAALAVLVPIVIGGIIAVLTGFATLGDFISFSEGAMSDVRLGAAGAAGIVAIVLIAAVAISVAIYIALRYSMSRFEVLDGAGIIESLRKSAIITRGVKWKLLGFILVLGLMNLVGLVLFLVGFLVTLPISMVAIAHVYTKLRAHHRS